MVGLAAADIVFHSLCDLKGSPSGNKKPAVYVPILCGGNALTFLSPRYAVLHPLECWNGVSILARVAVRFFDEAFGHPGTLWENADPISTDAEEVPYFRMVLSDLLSTLLQPHKLCTKAINAMGERFTSR